MSKQVMDYSKMTDHQIHQMMMNVLDKLGLRQKLYPAFMRKAHKLDSRDELLLHVKSTLERAKKLTELPDVTKKVTPISPVNTISEKNKNADVYTHTSHPHYYYYNQKGNTDLKNGKNDTPLSVWEKIHRLSANIEDAAQVARMAYYAKYKSIIIKVIDTFQVLNANDAVIKARELGFKESRKVLDRLLNDLYTDSLMDMEVVQCGLRNPSYVFFTYLCSKARVARYTKRLRASNGLTEKVTSPKRSHDKKGNAAEKVVNHNAEVQRLTVEKEQVLMKGSEERAVRKKKTKVTTYNKKAPELTSEYQRKFDHKLNKLEKEYLDNCKNKKMDEDKALKIFHAAKIEIYKETMKEQQEGVK